MNHWVVPLSSALPESLVGRKAAALSRLIAADFPVPYSACITTEALRAALSAQGELRLPDGLLEALHRVLQLNTPFTVRSSAVMEDLPERSLAGQYVTCLNVTGDSALERAILDCWRSYLAYPAATDRSGMAVLIQPQLDAECAGVCFRVDPIRSQPDLLLVTSNWGLGAGVVSGSIPSDAARLRRSDLGIEDLSIADKTRAARPATDAGGVALVSVAENQRRMACLPAEWLRRVGQFGLACEQFFASPQDIEWAVAGGKFWILQSRPITTLPESTRQATSFPVSWENDAEPRHFWWLVPHTDRPGAVIYPAEIDFIRASTQGGQDAVYMGGSADTRWFKFANGRQYMARAKSSLPPARVRINSAARQDLLKRMEQENTTYWDACGPEIILATNRLAAFDPSNAEGPALADHLENALATSIRHWMVHTLTPRPSRSQSLLEAYMQLSGLGVLQAPKELPALLTGLETIQTRLIDGLYELARLALEDPRIAEGIVYGRPVNLSSRPGLADFPSEYQRWITVYGHRLCYRAVPGYPADLPFPWRESPEHIWGMISAYLPRARQEDQPPPRQVRAVSFQATEERLERLITSIDDAALVDKFRQALAYARRNAVYLDEHNHYIDQLSEGQYVQALLYAGRWLKKQGNLPNSLDIFWLKVEEILTALNGQPSELEEICLERRAEFEGWQSLVPPACLGLPSHELEKRPEPATVEMVKEQPQIDERANALIGEPASRGQANGRARVVRDTSAIPQIAPGEVLITSYIPAAWTPLLALLAGVVLEVGSPGDHPSITAREFGVPVVCSALHATKVIPDGAWVSLDAFTGQVTWSETRCS